MNGFKSKAAISAAVMVLAGLIACGASAGADEMTGPITLTDEGSFFVGGDIVHTDAVSGDPKGPAGIGYANDDDLKFNQMYVQYQVPEGAADAVPIVLVHGCCLSAAEWEDTPDGRMGWAEYFLRNHHAMYLPDQTSRGRSGFNATVINEVRLGKKPPSELPDIYTLGRTAAWDLFRFGPKYPDVWPGEQFPIDALGTFASQVIPDLNTTSPQPDPTYKNLAELGKMAGGAVIVGHSESAFFPVEAALDDNAGVKGLIVIEGFCRELKPEEVAKLTKIPTLIIFGDHLDGSDVSKKIWPAALSTCETFAKQVNDAGGKVQLVKLPDIGCQGNSHMLMQDKNSLDIAAWVEKWLRDDVVQTHEVPTVGKVRG
ncbi:MAG TPA: hypothetical protein VG894_09510 [Bauldia sp.]|nr:hypothetical protein [Bauldia sp.]